MKNVAILSAEHDAVADPIDIALALLRADGLKAVAQLVSLIPPASGADYEARVQIVLVELLSLLLGTLEQDIESADAHDAIALLPPELAFAAHDLLLLSNFGDGEGMLSALDDMSVLCLTGLLIAGGQADQALALLNEAGQQRPTASFARGAYAVRCRALGVDGSIRTLWLATEADGTDFAGGDVEEARTAMEAQPLDPRGHRTFARLLAEQGRVDEALAAFSVGLALPIGAADKAGLGEDLGVYAAWLATRRDTAGLNARRVRLALGACLPAAARAEAALAKLPRKGAHAAIDDAAIATTIRYFRETAWHPERVGASAYPTRNGKPYIETVWLEITNHCNQKCTFCPDMHREDARTWLPLEQVKRTIDELAETFTVGAMQLNAYGEPLIHPNIKEILDYIREKRLPFPTFFTSHGMTLVEKKLKQLSHNYPAGIAISLHNDSQESYAATRSAKIGDYDTLVERVSALLRQMVNEGAACHLRLYQMVSNGHEDMQVDPKVRGAFPNTVERMTAHVRKWEAIAAEIADAAPPEVRAEAIVNPRRRIEEAFSTASHGEGVHLPVIRWHDANGTAQTAFMSARPVGTYANLLLEYHPDWTVERKVVSRNTCSYFTVAPSLAIFATGKLGICCLDMNSTATFGSLSDFGSLREALTSPEARRMFAQLANGVATSRGCQICLGTGKQMCGGKEDRTVPA